MRADITSLKATLGSGKWRRLLTFPASGLIPDPENFKMREVTNRLGVQPWAVSGAAGCVFKLEECPPAIPNDVAGGGRIWIPGGAFGPGRWVVRGWARGVVASGGASAASIQRRAFALKVWFASSAHLEAVYRDLDGAKSSGLRKWLPGFTFQKHGLRWGADTFLPTLIMPWCHGEWLDGAVEAAVVARKADEVRNIRQALGSMARDLKDLKVAHRDICPENILVEKGATGVRLSLVDYDDFCTTSTEGHVSLSNGRPEYQHPLRFSAGDKKYLYDDRYSFLVLYFVLLCLEIAIDEEANGNPDLLAGLREISPDLALPLFKSDQFRKCRIMLERPSALRRLLGRPDIRCLVSKLEESGRARSLGALPCVTSVLGADGSLAPDELKKWSGFLAKLRFTLGI